jgi:MoxR-like ATPase
MDTIKAGGPLIRFIELCFTANLPPLLVGHSGVGKSELLKQAAHKLGVQFICRDLSLMEPPDLMGLPQVNGQSTVYLPPDFLPRSGRGILVFEELNRCEKFMQAPCLQLLTTRTLNDYRLPEGWLPAAAINPPDSDYLVNQMDPALLFRFVQARVVPDQREWLRWARGSGIHSSVIAYVESDTSVFDRADSNPRSWTYVSRLVHAAERCRASSRTLRAAVLGTVGDKRGAAFLRLLKEAEQPLTAEAITASYDQHRAGVNRWIAAGRLDLVERSLQSLLTFLQPEAEYLTIRGTASSCANIRSFLGDLPGDLQVQARTFFNERGYVFPLQRRGRATT